MCYFQIFGHLMHTPHYSHWPLFFQPRLSTEREIVLDDVDFSTTGHYRCEVSGDAPMFQTASTEGILYVVGKLSLEKSREIALQSKFSRQE